MARAVNAEAPAAMAEEARKIGAALIHYSTDYVFDGLKNSPYVEEDPPNPLSVYGKTKLMGEQAVRDVGVPHLTFRAAWIYGRRGRNFLLTILRLAAQRPELRIVCDQFGTPTWSREVARGTAEILKQLCSRPGGLASLAEVSGTYHMTAAGETSWYEFTRAILEESSRVPPDTDWLATATGGLPIIARTVVPITTKEYPTPARRPAYSVLSNSRLMRTFGFQLPDWRTQLRSAFVDDKDPEVLTNS
jgi:dTDP-4-dehydrorhamnose reductase